MKRELNHSEFFIKANKLAGDIIRHDKRFTKRLFTRSRAMSEAFKRIRHIYYIVNQLSKGELDSRERERQENERPEFERVMKFYSRSIWNSGNWTGD
jgi:hypothetical protein